MLRIRHSAPVTTSSCCTMMGPKAPKKPTIVITPVWNQHQSGSWQISVRADANCAGSDARTSHMTCSAPNCEKIKASGLVNATFWSSNLVFMGNKSVHNAATMVEWSFGRCFIYWLLNALIKGRWRLQPTLSGVYVEALQNATECVYSATIDVCAAIDASLWHLVGSSFQEVPLFRFVPKSFSTLCGVHLLQNRDDYYHIIIMIHKQTKCFYYIIYKNPQKWIH